MPANINNEAPEERIRAVDSPKLRVQPVQKRSRDQLERILIGAAEIIDEVGAEHLSTADVASRAGCSIGSVYRMFPDKHRLFEHLASRNIDVVLTRLADHSDGVEASAADVVRVFMSAQQVPGFSSLRVGSALHIMKRNGYREIAQAIIRSTPASGGNEEAVYTALFGVAGILIAESEEEMAAVMAADLLARALAA